LLVFPASRYATLMRGDRFDFQISIAHGVSP
jgi:hypothetical protein